MNQSAFFEAFGWSLIDSLWQMGAVWLAYILITRNGSRYSAGKRHTLALLGIGSGTLLFFTGIIANIYSFFTNGRIFSLAYFAEQQAGDIFGGYTFAFVSSLPYFYLPALVFFAMRFLFQLSKRNSGKDLIAASEQWTILFNDVCARVGMSKNVALWLTEKIDSPLTLGFWKPVVLLPFAVLGNLSYKQAEAVIAHELFHIKRNDYLLNIFLTFSEIVLFFNPFARLLAGIVRKERENSCDDRVIGAGFDALEYSQALYLLGKYRLQNDRLAIAATGMGKDFLLQRIRRIMSRHNARPSLIKPLATFFLCLFVAGFASRNHRVQVLAAAEEVVAARPVVYYAEEKKIVVEEPVIVKRPKKLVVPPPVAAPAPPPPVRNVPAPPAPLMPEGDDVSDKVSLTRDADVVVTRFVSEPTVIEFTFLDDPEPVVPETPRETPQPYVQKSSFYFTEIDTTTSKKVIDL